MKYRSLKGYKYQTLEQMHYYTGIKTGNLARTPFIVLDKDGFLVIAKGYAWDGPSGPTIDTETFMRGSLIHDALYQLIRENLLWGGHRKAADKILREICIEDGMTRFRAWYVYLAVRAFGRMLAL